MEVANRCMWHSAWCHYLVPMAHMQTTDMEPNFLGPGQPVNSYSKHEQDLNAIRNEWEEYKVATVYQTCHLEFHVYKNIGVPVLQCHSWQ